MHQKKVHNFSAGPCVLPKEVFITAQKEMLDWHGTGLSVMEMSHRGKYFTEIAENARDKLRILMDIPDDFQIYFFQGGASMQYSCIPLNLLGDAGGASNYLTTGFWSEGAIAEARKFTDATEVANNAKHQCTDIDSPETWTFNKDAKYFHFCDNETIGGFEFSPFPWEVVPKGQLIVCDMSSNFCSRPIDWQKYDVIYAGAQKNVGPAGICITVIRKSLLQHKCKKDAPLLCDWPLFDKAANTFHNTPNCWSIYMCGLNIEHMIQEGGIPVMEQKAEQRSKMLYQAIDSSEGYYINNVVPKYRSRMNIPFRVRNDPNLERKFLAEATAAGLMELAGHKSVGGCRASLYNAMTIEGVQALVDFMASFRAAN